MSNRGWMIAGGAGAGLIALWLLPTWVALVLIAIVVGVPVAGYFMLDPSQRRRLHSAHRRGKLRG